jgi:hypothetical protein
MGAKLAEIVGSILGLGIAPHEKASHEERPCWPGRVEVAAFVMHLFGLRPQDMGRVKARLEEHLAECKCPPRAAPPEGW